MKFNTRTALTLSALAPLASALLPIIEQQQQQQPLLSDPETSNTVTENDIPSYRVPLLSLHRTLVNTPSISGTEGQVALDLKKLLIDLDFTVQLQRVPPAAARIHDDDDDDDDESPQFRYNVLAWPGRHATPAFHNRTLITSHIDVVPPFLPYAINGTPVPPSEPLDFTSLPSDTLISGRGSVDAKGSVAAQITATKELLENGELDPASVVLLYVVGEEISGDGMKFFSSFLANQTTSSTSSSSVSLHAAIFGEPTTNLLACGHKGIASALLTATGKAGHSGYPWLGRSATALLIRALDRLLQADLGSSKRYGNTTVNVGVVQGGVAANVIAKEAWAKMAVRIAVGGRESGRGVVEREMERVVRELVVGHGYGPVECECDVEGFGTMVANYGTDVPNLEGEHTNYLYGPGTILVAHGDNEGLTIQDLEEAVEGYKRLIKHAVGA
ncbi:hypothetical protein B0J18DRAFT_402494 [Chaetomium sp. MPI-SDFR-AT-0129]|nr:hypothetical protein B0J18DRAFT_402494 [Chaetomium sp. MPI-SDFR-AT-0129]